MTQHTDFDLDHEERCRLLDDWVQTRRQIAALEAHASDLLVDRIAVHDRDVAESPFHRDAIYRSMIAEYAAAAHLTAWTVEHSFTEARTLSRDLPAVQAAFTAGTITVAHVREIVRASGIVGEAVRNRRVDADTLGLFEQAVLEVAEHDTASRTRAHARQVAAALVQETVVERHRRAVDERCVSVRSVDDGLALLTAVLPEWLAVAIADRLTRMAREVIRTRSGDEPVSRGTTDEHAAASADLTDDHATAETDFTDEHAAAPTDLFDEHAAAPTDLFDEHAAAPTDLFDEHAAAHTDPTDEQARNDERTIDQVRADLFADLLLAAEPSEVLGSGLGAIQPRIQVTVAATTLLGADDRPAELDGHGPLDPDIARALAGHHSGWSRLFLDGEGLVTDTDTYTPTEQMRRFLRARDQHCRFPGCRMPVHRCDIDHNHDHALGGRTRTDNLSHFCRSHHTLKHPHIDDRYRWTAHQGPGGDVTWTSPLGRTYSDHPRRRVMFV
ncbi:DUF222 domain-containing protein [Microbacterium sp. NPDC089695]|uniref:HNH endonuclease signature motif containing protein n=1 Tax=Microbacterium sp. NPDC089695 TaxID=3364198 RepID=UPI00382AD5CE